MPLPRPHDPRRATPFPTPPPSLCGMEGIPGLAPPGALARVAQRLGRTLAEVDRAMTVDEVLDEFDLQAYLFDVDNAPQDRPPK